MGLREMSGIFRGTGSIVNSTLGSTGIGCGTRAKRGYRLRRPKARSGWIPGGTRLTSYHGTRFILDLTDWMHCIDGRGIQVGSDHEQ